VPRGEIIRRESSLADACKYVGFPLVIKPVDGNHGRGITVNINNYDEALVAYHACQKCF
jgi:cyanophycin synthetase